MSAINKWHSRIVEFIQAYPQAPIQYDLYMEFPKGFKTKEGDRRTHVLQLLKNLYGQNQAGRMWNQHPNEKICQVVFKKSAMDECVWYKDATILFYYVDDRLFMRPESKAINMESEEIYRAVLDNEYKENIEDHLGVNVEDQDKGKIKLPQLQIIDRIINDVQIPNKTTPQQTPALSTKILNYDADSPTFNEGFNHQSVVGKLNFLEKSTRPNISYTMHQCTHFSQDTWASHMDTRIHLVKYLKAIRAQITTLDPKGRKSFKVYVNADFCGNWHRPTAGNNISTAKSWTGYAILYNV